MLLYRGKTAKMGFSSHLDKEFPFLRLINMWSIGLRPPADTNAKRFYETSPVGISCHIKHKKGAFLT